ncbi:MAG: SMP-30/gluconolactonase/LRE family protein [Candidatus Zhuqueibacterota bacterium]
MRTPVDQFFRLMILLGLFVFPTMGLSQQFIEFNSGRWDLSNATLVDFLGRKAMMGTAVLTDVVFGDGVIEVDMAVTGGRSYPAINFRIVDDDNCERFYIRPHRAGLYPDALQYTPVFNKVAGWQLYSGEGFTAAGNIPVNQWLHVKIDVKGSQARVFLNGASEPALVIHDLKHGVATGKLGLSGPRDGSAYFSNFCVTTEESLKFEQPVADATPAGMMMDWEISKVFNAEKIDIEVIDYPGFYQIFYAGWQPVKAASSGLVDIARFVKRNPQRPECLLARTIVNSDEMLDVKLTFGYSDEVTLFHNGKKLFYGMSAYQWRDPSFLGIVGLNDVAFLTLEKGLNEIMLVVKESFGGWGFMMKADTTLTPPKKQHDRVAKAWETEAVFLTPESVVYDPGQDALFVSSFDNRYKKDAGPEEYTGFISKLKITGEIEALKWAAPLHGPCGLAIYKKKLYTVERCNLTEIDLKTGKILKRYPIPGCDFPNDLIVDSDGSVYISDTSPTDHRASRIYKFKGGTFEVWERGGEIRRANGLFIHEGKLLIGNTGDGCFKSADLATKKIGTIACLGAGVVDGIRVDDRGDYLVSHWEGQLYRISPAGRVTELLDTIGDINLADFEYIKEKKLLIVPTFVGNKVVAYKLID